MPAKAPKKVDTPNAGKAAADRRKKVIVVLLLVGLLIAIVTQPADDAESTADLGEQAPTLSESVPTVRAEVVQPEAKEENRFASTRELARIELEQIVGSSVFESDPADDDFVSDEVAPPDVKVRAVYGTGDARSALVGTEIVRSGQPLRDGRRVLKVTHDGIELGR